MAGFKIQNGRAVGPYWGGGGIRCRIESELIADKVLEANITKIEAMGMPMALWLEASKVMDNPTQCSCYKDTSKQPDIPCLTCYGNGVIPGYIKFGTRTYWASPIEGLWTYSNTVLDKNNRPFRIQLDAASTTGTAISPNFILNLGSKAGSWDAHVDAFTRDGGANSSITVEASKDDGSTWFPLTDLETQAPTQLKFKVTFARTATTVKSPMFEIVRARFPLFLDVMQELNEPVIRVLQTWTNESEVRQQFGAKMEVQGNTFWTLPLHLFDSTIALGSRKDRIRDDSFVEVRYGGDLGYRYALNQFMYSDQFGVFTRQQFTLRKTADNIDQTNDSEIYGKVW